MGPAYENSGELFTADVGSYNNCYELVDFQSIPAGIVNNIHEGDEFIVLEDISSGPQPDLRALTKATFVRKVSGTHYFDLDDTSISGTYYLLNYRPGKRNMLDRESAAITALDDPTQDLGVHTELSIDVVTVSGTEQTTVSTSKIYDCINATASTYTDAWNGVTESCLETEMELPQENPPVGVGSSGNCESLCPPYYDMCCYFLYFNLEVPPTGALCDCEITVSWIENGIAMEEVINYSGGQVEGSPANCLNGYPLGCYSEEPEIVDLNYTISCNDKLGSCDPSSAIVNLLLCEGDPANCGPSGPEITTNPFKGGYRGIWRKHQDFQFVDDRVYATTEYREEGKLSEVPLYSWKDPFFEYSNAGKKWKLLSEVTSYERSGQASEEKNILGVYNMARYAYNGDLVKCAGENMRHIESGFEGFEEIPNSALGDGGNNGLDQFPITLFSGNIDFPCDPYCYEYIESYNIVGAYTGSGNVLIDRPFTFTADKPVSVAFRLKDHAGNVHYYSSGVSSVQARPVSGTGEILFAEENLTELVLSGGSCESLPPGIYGGRAVLTYERDYEDHANCSNVLITEDESHTGTHSLGVENANVKFHQKRIKVQEEQDYIISAWVRTRTQEPVPTYASGSVGIALTIGANTAFFEPEGPIIEGWQRIEGRIKAGTDPGQEFSIELRATNEEMVWFDDFRFYPADGNMQSFVYDRKNYRLTEVLDYNNYFTRYIYDDQGQLVATMKETEDGIKTLEEQRVYQNPLN